MPPTVAASRSAWARVRLATVSRRTLLARDAGCQGAHRSRADDQHLATRQRAEHADRLVQCRGDQRPAGPVDAGLGAGALADAQRLLGELVEGPAGRAGLLRQSQRDLDLADDLALSDDHRVEPARDGEQVRHRPVLVLHVEVRSQPVQRHLCMAGEQGRRLGDTGMELVDVGVDLDPVAGGEDDRLGCVLAADQVGEQLGHGVACRVLRARAG